MSYASQKRIYKFIIFNKLPFILIYSMKSLTVRFFVVYVIKNYMKRLKNVLMKHMLMHIGG